MCFNTSALSTPRKFQEQECPPSPEPTRKEKDKSGCHCVIVWVCLITVTHAATLPPHPLCLTSDPKWMTDRCLLHVHDFRQPFLRYFDQELLFPGHRYGQLTMPNFNTTLPSAVIEFTCESPNTKHCLLNQPDKLIFCTLKDFSCLVVTFVLLPSLNEIYISRMLTIFSSSVWPEQRDYLMKLCICCAISTFTPMC